MPKSTAAKPAEPGRVDPLWRVYDQLVSMQTELASRLAKEFNGGDMALMASVTGCIGGITAELARRR
jgi:hypothetical protein